MLLQKRIYNNIRAKKHQNEEPFALTSEQDLVTDHSYRIVDDDQLPEYMHNKAIYIKIFYHFHDKRFLLTHHSWWKKTDNDLKSIL
ncbi:hypothetical protein [Spiroplasma endosymbiont of Polydrusus cervinus]|uniref:hypothetical protein n=1 Tax=Spiroplasma endosymbiont of Polydrusus cervinus TaxID=3066287 RepID=UPI0030CBCB11